MSIEERFNTAVNVIKGLPKNGPFQPSYDMMLRFYSYFKQATEGPCRSRRPAFWDVVGKVKYDTWKRLGDMSREKAMAAYVEELRQIVETMSYTQNVAEFYNSLNQFDMKIEDIELIAPDLIRSKSQENSPQHKIEAIENVQGDIPNTQVYSNSTEETSSDDDEYIDTVDEEIAVERPREKSYAHLNGGIHKKTQPMTEVTNKLNIDPSLASHLVQISDKMKLDLQQVNNRMNVLEQKITKQRKYPKWWPFQDISPSFFAFTLLYPIAVAFVFRAIQQRKQLLNHGGGGGKRS